MTVIPSSALRFVPLAGRESADPFRDQASMTEANLSVRIVRMVADPSRSSHVHAHSAEAVFVAQGRGTLWANGVRTHLETGDTILIPAGVHHATLPDPESEMLLVCFFPHPDLSANIEELSSPL